MLFEQTTLGNVSKGGKGNYGIAASAVDYSNELYTYLRITDIKDDGTIDFGGLKSVNDEKAANYLLQPNDIVFARTGASTGRNYFYDGSDAQFVYAGFLIKFSIDPDKVNPKYIKYYCLSQEYKRWIASYNTGSTRGNINAQTLAQMPLLLPERMQQDKMVDILSSIDRKIKENKKINKNLLQQAQALYKNRFVDLHPFNGEMPPDWHFGEVSEIIELHDSKRIPLSSRERATLTKLYPYYGATSVMDYVDRYLFDGIYLLLGEDGTVVDNDGFPILQYVEGKFWVNNHAHIITGKNGFTVETLYLLFSLTNVQSIITGAVQPKISQTNLNKMPIVIPSEAELSDFDSVIQPIFAQIRNLRAQNDRLAVTRDTLLPLLMSGEVDVSNLNL
ncbi:restriction endonuclease subunit S [Gardnerella vaginalis]|uniref:restriction endonuclease subunit S n=1 Tax=Gardnerella vaginalis TaxID=2702 RepID=UPI0015E0ACC1|nr:restriction endonuclease subunit S [Gardnerella vaginalis]